MECFDNFENNQKYQKSTVSIENNSQKFQKSMVSVENKSKKNSKILKIDGSFWTYFRTYFRTFS